MEYFGKGSILSLDIYYSRSHEANHDAKDDKNVISKSSIPYISNSEATTNLIIANHYKYVSHSIKTTICPPC